MERAPKFDGTNAVEKENSGLTERQRRALRNTLAALGLAGILTQADEVKEAYNDLTNEAMPSEQTDNTQATANTEEEKLESLLADVGATIQSETSPETADNPTSVTSVEDTESAMSAEAKSNETAVEESNTSLRPQTRPEKWAEYNSAEAVTTREGERFQAYTEAIATSKTMRRDQVVFTDQYGQMLTGEAVSLTPAAGYTVEEMTWRYEGRQKDPENTLPVGIPGMWTQEQREKLAKATGVPVAEISMHHTYLAMLGSQYEGAESLLEIALERAGSVVPGDHQERDYLSYIQAEFSPSFKSPYGLALSAELKATLPALIAQESGFNNDAVSSVGATGALQIMPDTWQQYVDRGLVNQEADPTNFTEALPVTEAYFEDTFTYFTTEFRSELDSIKSDYFANDEEEFMRSFMAPLLINTYNVGMGNMGKVLAWYNKELGTATTLQAALDTKTVPTGVDVFFAITQAAYAADAVPAYQEYGSAYTWDIYGWRKAMESHQPEATPYMVASQ